MARNVTNVIAAKHLSADRRANREIGDYIRNIFDEMFENDDGAIVNFIVGAPDEPIEVDKIVKTNKLFRIITDGVFPDGWFDDKPLVPILREREEKLEIFYDEELNICFTKGPVFFENQPLKSKNSIKSIANFIVEKIHQIRETTFQKPSYHKSRAELLEQLKEIKPHSEDSLDNILIEIEQRKNTVADLRGRVSRELFRIKELNDKIEAMSKVKSFYDKLVSELKLISQLSEIKDIEVNTSNKEIVFLTNNIDVINQDDDVHYKGPEYKIHIHLNSADIRVYSQTGYKGLWSPRDPHPHIQHPSGRACFGNVEATLATLFSENELYAIVITVIGYLKSVNISDSAGKYVLYRTGYNADGTVKHYGYSTKYSNSITYTMYTKGFYPLDENGIIDEKEFKKSHTLSLDDGGDDDDDDYYDYTCDYCGDECYEHETHEVRLNPFQAVDVDGNVYWDFEGTLNVCEDCWEEDVQFHEETNSYVIFRG